MVKTLRQLAKEDPQLEVTRNDANEILDIAWENCLNDFELGPLWRELETMYGLKSHSRPGQPDSRYYYLNQIVDALERRDRKEVYCVPQPSEDYDPASFWCVKFDVDDDALVTVEQILVELPIITKKPREAVRRLGVEPVSYSGREPLYRFGDVKEKWLAKQTLNDSDG